MNRRRRLLGLGDWEGFAEEELKSMTIIYADINNNVFTDENNEHIYTFEELDALAASGPVGVVLHSIEDLSPAIVPLKKHPVSINEYLWTYSYFHVFTVQMDSETAMALSTQMGINSNDEVNSTTHYWQWHVTNDD